MTRVTDRWRAPRTLVALLVGALIAVGCGNDGDGDAAPDPADGDEATADGDEDVDGGDDGGDGEPQDFGEPVTLTFGHPFPPTDPIQVNVWEPWVEEVREATGGTVDIEIHAGGALAPAPQVYENTVAGAQDMGWTMPGYTPGRFPITQIIEAPFAFEGPVEGTEVAWDLWEEFDEFQDEFGDVELLSMWAMDTGDLFTRDQPVETLEDLAGLTIRSPSPLQSLALEAMGAAAVSMPGPDIYDSVERGVIDGYKLANSATRVFDLGATTSYRTVCNCYTGAFVLVINEGAWERLSPAQQDAITELSGRDLGIRLSTEHAAMADDVEENYWPDNGVESIELADDEFERWRDAVQPVYEQWIEERESEGVPGRAMADRVLGANAS